MKELPETNEPIGLDFLGYHFKNIECSAHRGVKSTQGKKQLFRLLTHPSRGAVKRHKSNLRFIFNSYKKAPLEKVIERMASTIRGWA